MPKYHIKKIAVHPSVASVSITERIIGRLPGIPVEITKYPLEKKDNKSLSNRITLGKQVLWITKHEGKFLHTCPGTPGMRCCNYYVLDVIENCPLDCTYCFLQGYLSNKYITVYANISDLFQEVFKFRKSNPDELIRIGTGELSDSLALDDITGISSELIPFFLEQKNFILELKTKTNQISQLRYYNTKDKVVTAWSVNPESVIKSEEIHSVGLTERLEAAKQCREWGYKIAFHFDPIIHIPLWEEEYACVVDRIFSVISPDSLAWISLGTLRFFPLLSEAIKERFPETPIVYGEQFRGKDGKMRYLRTIRERMYRTIVERIREYAPHVPVYLCMESSQVWRNVFGWSPGYRIPWSEYYDRGILKGKSILL